MTVLLLVSNVYKQLNAYIIIDLLLEVNESKQSELYVPGELFHEMGSLSI